MLPVDELEKRLIPYDMSPATFEKGIRALKVYRFLADEHVAGFGWMRTRREELRYIISDYLGVRCRIGYATGKYISGEFFFLESDKYTDILQNVEGFYSSDKFKY